MELKLTNEQYKKLLELIYAGNWVINGCKDERDIQYDEIEQLIYKQYKEVDASAIIDTEDGLSLAKNLEDKVVEHIDYYDEDVFYLELASKLARKKISKLSKSSVSELNELEDEYLDEFEENGIKNIEFIYKNEKI